MILRYVSKRSDFVLHGIAILIAQDRVASVSTYIVLAAVGLSTDELLTRGEEDRALRGRSLQLISQRIP